MQREIVAPSGDDQSVASIRPAKIMRDYSTDDCVRGDHPFVRNPHGVDEIGLGFVEEFAQLFCGASNR